MLKSSHVNVWAAVSISSILLSWWYFSIFLLYYPFLSLLNDADHDKSWISNALHLKLPLSKHRWYSHSLLFNVLVWFVLYFWLKHFYPDSLTITDLYVLLGLTNAHILWDFFTKRWVPLLYPFLDTSFWFPLFTTWTILEKLVTLFISFWNVAWFIYIIMNYVLPWNLIIPVYDMKLILIAVCVNAFVTYLLLQDEIKYMHRNIKKIIMSSITTISYIIINILSLIWLYYVNLVKNFFDLNILVEKTWLPLNIIIMWIAVIWIIPSFLRVLKSIDDIAFEFASSINIVFISCILGIFTLKLL